jgi:hypothetical protein
MTFVSEKEICLIRIKNEFTSSPSFLSLKLVCRRNKERRRRHIIFENLVEEEV